MIHIIGDTAGKIWKLLDKQGELTFGKIKKSLGGKDSDLYMAIGWLAREDQIQITSDGRMTQFSIKK